MYSKIFKNNQVIYGRPFQIRGLSDIQNAGNDKAESGNASINDEKLPEPKDLLENAKKESELLIKEATLEAERILEEAKKEAELKAREIAEDAWQRGYAEGMEAAAKQNEAILAEAEKIRQSAEQEHKSIMAGLEADIINLVINVARKVVAGELATNGEVIRQLVAEALAGCSNKNGAVLKVSPEDYDYIEKNKDSIIPSIEGMDMLEIKKDFSMKKGGCIVETPLGSVDAGVDTKLDKIEEAFREMLGDIAE